MELHHGFGGISFWDNHEMPPAFAGIHSDLTRLGGPYAARREVAGFSMGAMLEDPEERRGNEQTAGHRFRRARQCLQARGARLAGRELEEMKFSSE